MLYVETEIKSSSTSGDSFMTQEAVPRGFLVAIFCQDADVLTESEGSRHSVKVG